MFSVSKTPRTGSICYNNMYYGFNENFNINNNPLSYGYIDEIGLVDFKFNTAFAWNVSTSFSDQHSSFLHHAYNYARNLTETKKTIILLVSGGIDSEMLIRSFLPVASIVQLVFFDYTCNKEDYLDLQRTLPANFKINYIKIDATNFFNSNHHLWYGLRYRTSFPEVMLFLYSLDCLKLSNDCHLVISGDIPEPAIVNNELKFSYPSDNICALDRWSKVQKISITSSFLLANNLQSDLVHSALLNYNCFLYADKKTLYQELGYCNIPLRRLKLTGLEELRKTYNIWNFSKIIEDFKIGYETKIIIEFLDEYHTTLNATC